MAEGAAQVCPVCYWPTGQNPRCRWCHWDPGDGAELATAAAAGRLTAAQRDWDLRAAARASVINGSRSQALLRRLAALARGGPADDSHVTRLAAQVDEEDRPPAQTSAGVVFTLTRLAAGRIGAIVFVEIGRDDISVQTLGVGANGVPVKRVSDRLPWAAIMPMLPADADQRAFRMAGGIGREPGGGGAAAGAVGPADPVAAIDDVIKPVVARMTAAAAAAAMVSGTGAEAPPPPGKPERLDAVLVRRTHYWPLLDAIVARIRAAVRPVAEIVAAPKQGPLAVIVDDVATQMPLRYAYDLVLVETDERTGEVRPQSYQLFPAGTVARPGAPPTRTVTVSAVPGRAADRLALPIVARRGPDPDWGDQGAIRQARPLALMASADDTPPGPFQLHIELIGPGQLRVRPAPAPPRPGVVAVTWPEVMGELGGASPARPLTGSLDLVVLIELGGLQEEVVRARVHLARGLVRELREVPGAMVAVLGYRDHFGRHLADAIGDRDRDRESLIIGYGLSPVAGALKKFRRAEWWTMTEVNHDGAAPLEDALQLLTFKGREGWQWRPGARHVVLVIGARPPHPARVAGNGGLAIPCPLHHSWQVTLARLRSEQNVECFAVLDRHLLDSRDPPVPRDAQAFGYASSAWRELTGNGTFPLESTGAARLAQAVGVAPAPRAPLHLAALVGASLPAPQGEEAAP